MNFPRYKDCTDSDCECNAKLNWKKVDPDTLQVYEAEYLCRCGEEWREAV